MRPIFLDRCKRSSCLLKKSRGNTPCNFHVKSQLSREDVHVGAI